MFGCPASHLSSCIWGHFPMCGSWCSLLPTCRLPPCSPGSLSLSARGVGHGSRLGQSRSFPGLRPGEGQAQQGLFSTACSDQTASPRHGPGKGAWDRLPLVLPLLHPGSRLPVSLLSSSSPLDSTFLLKSVSGLQLRVMTGARVKTVSGCWVGMAGPRRSLVGSLGWQ